MMVYYVIALALYMQVSYGEVLRCLLEGLRWLQDAHQRAPAPSRSGISRARIRLGAEPLRRLHDEVVRPIAAPGDRDSWYAGRRLVSLDGSVLDLADDPFPPRSVRSSGGLAGRRRVSPAALRLAGGKRHARALRLSPGALCGE